MSNTEIKDYNRITKTKEVQKSPSSKTVDEVIGMLHNPNQIVISIEEMNDDK